MSSVIKEARQMSVCNPHLLAGRSRDPAYIFYHACKNQVLMFFWLLYVYKTYLKMLNEQPDSYLSTVQNPTVFSVVLFSQMKTWNLLLKVGMSQYWEVTRGVPFKNIFSSSSHSSNGWHHFIDISWHGLILSYVFYWYLKTEFNFGSCTEQCLYIFIWWFNLKNVESYI